MTTTPNTVPKDAGDWFSWVQSRLRVLERHRHGGEDTYTTTAEVMLSMDPNFTFNSVGVRVSGSVVQFTGNVTRTGASIAGVASGDIGNTTIGVLNAEFWPFASAAVASTESGSVAHFVVYEDGTFQVVSLSPNNGWPTGAVVTFSGTWILPDNTV